MFSGKIEVDASVKTGSRGLLMMLLLIIMPWQTCFAAFDSTPYQIPLATSAGIPDDLLYPPYFQETDQITINNVIAEIRSRFEFISGVRPEPSYLICFKMQHRIDKALERTFTARKELPFSYIDDRLIYHPESPFFEYLRPMPMKSTDFCSFKSFGDLLHGGTVYCAYHGPDINGKFYRDHQHELEKSRPLFTAFDLVELLIFLPALLIIPVIWLIMKKALQKKQPADNDSQG